MPATPSQLTAWRGGALIQTVMPELTADQRELLISQTCGKCWDALFADGDEDGPAGSEYSYPNNDEAYRQSMKDAGRGHLLD